MTKNEQMLEWLVKASQAHDLAERYEADNEPELAVFWRNGAKGFEDRVRKAMNEKPTA